MFKILILICGIGHLMASLILRTEPGNSNRIAGYRTKRSMKNEVLWKLGQSYAGKLLVLAGIINVLVGVIVLLFLRYENEFYVFLELLWVIVSWMLVFILTEYKLKRKEEEIKKQ